MSFIFVVCIVNFRAVCPKKSLIKAQSYSSLSNVLRNYICGFGGLYYPDDDDH